MGNNPMSTFSGAPNADYTKQKQQTAQNKMFGTPEQRVAQQRAIDSAQPWKVKTPDRPIVGKQNESARVAMSSPQAATQHGIKSQALVDVLTEQGWLKKGGGISGLGVLPGGDYGAVADKFYGGDQDALATAVRKYGVAAADKKHAAEIAKLMGASKRNADPLGGLGKIMNGG